MERATVFVYGSLRPEIRPRFWREHELPVLNDGARALMFGTLYDLGAFPGFAPAAPYASVVLGSLIDVDAEGLSRLDLLERHPIDYRRESGIAYLEAGDAVEVQVYRSCLVRPAVHTVVPGGDWVTVIRAREASARPRQRAGAARSR